MENQRIRTIKSYNLHLLDLDRVCGKFEMPILEPCDIVPTELIGFNYVLSDKEPRGGVHFYIDDYQFERIWNSPERYISLLSRYECVLTPDFSLYLDMPYSMKIWNLYRARLIGQYFQDQGIPVVPSLSWAEPETYKFCFDGLATQSTYAVSNVGCIKRKRSKDIWFQGFHKALEVLRPKRLLIYGTEISLDFPGVPEIIFYSCPNRYKE